MGGGGKFVCQSNKTFVQDFSWLLSPHLASPQLTVALPARLNARHSPAASERRHIYPTRLSIVRGRSTLTRLLTGRASNYSRFWPVLSCSHVRSRKMHPLSREPGRSFALLSVHLDPARLSVCRSRPPPPPPPPPLAGLLANSSGLWWCAL